MEKNIVLPGVVAQSCLWPYQVSDYKVIYNLARIGKQGHSAKNSNFTFRTSQEKAF